MKKIYLLALLPLAAPAAPERLNPQERLRPPNRAAYAAPTPLPLLPPAHFNNGIHFTPRPTPTVLYFDAQGQPAATASAGGYRRHIVGQTKDGLLVAQDFYQDSDSPQTALFLLSPGHEADFGEAGLNGRVYSYRPDGRLQSATTYQRGQRIGWRYWSDGEHYVFAESNGPKAVQVLLDEQGHTQIWREPTQTLYFYPAGNALARAVGSHWQYWGPDGGPLRPLSPLQPQPEGLVHHQLLLQQYRQLQAVHTLMAPANSQSIAASANRTTGGSASASGAAPDGAHRLAAGQNASARGSASTAGANQSVEQSASASATAPAGAHRLAAGQTASASAQQSASAAVVSQTSTPAGEPSASAKGSASSSETSNQTATAGQVAEGSAAASAPQRDEPSASAAAVSQTSTPAGEPSAAVGANQAAEGSASAREVSQTATAEGSASASAPQRSEATASALEAGQMAAAGNQTAPAGQSASVVANQAAEGSALVQNDSPTVNPAAAVATVAQQLPDSIAPRAGVDPATASAAGVPPAESSPAPTPDVGAGEVVAVLREENPPAGANPAPSTAVIGNQVSASVQNAAAANQTTQGSASASEVSSQTATASNDASQTATAGNQTATAGQSASVQTNASAGANQTAAGSASAPEASQNVAAASQTAQGSASVQNASNQATTPSASAVNASQTATPNGAVQGGSASAPEASQNVAAANQTTAEPSASASGNQGSASVVEAAHQATGQSASAPNPAPAVVDGDDDDSTLPELQALGVDGRAPHLAEMVASLRLPTATSLTGELQPFRDLYTVRANDYQSPLAYQPAPTKTVYAFDSQGQPLASNQGAAYFRELLGTGADGWSVVRDYYANGAPQTAPYRLPPGSERVFRHSPAEGLLLVFGPDGTVKTVGNFSRGVPVGWLNTVAQGRISSASLYHGSQRRALLQYDSREQPWRLLSGDRLVYFYPDGQPLAEFIATRRRPVSLWNRDGSPRPLSAWPDNRDPDEVAAQLRQQP